MIRSHLLGPIQPQYDLVREPIRDQVAGSGKQKADDDTLRASENIANDQKESADAAKQERCFHPIAHTSIVRRRIDLKIRRSTLTFRDARVWQFVAGNESRRGKSIKGEVVRA